MARHFTVFLIVGCMLWLGVGCSSSNFTVVEAARDTRFQFTDISVEQDIRRGNELGLLLRAQVDAQDGNPEQLYVRFSWMDLDGQVLEGNRFVETITDLPELDSAGKETGEYAPAIVLVPAPIIRFDGATGIFPMRVECFLPYQWFKLPQGRQRVRVALEAFAGRMEGRPELDFGGVLMASQDRPIVGKTVGEFEFDVPKLYAARLLVRELALDSSTFDPYQMDRFTNPVFQASEAGLPDVFWTVGLGYEEVFASTYFENSLSGQWKEWSPLIYVRHRDEVLSLCAMDWDPQQAYGKGHDILGCWEGRLIQISTDPEQPSLLKVDRVKKMEVLLEWLTE